MAQKAFDVQRYLLESKLSVDRALDHYLKTDHDTSLLHQAVCYSVLDGGKRFRPTLTLAVGELFGAKRRDLLSFACAIELIHCYSLIHDDLPALDNDDLRRGKLSCHKQFGEAIALLAGDALLTEAFFIMSDPRMARLLGAPLISKLIRAVRRNLCAKLPNTWLKEQSSQRSTVKLVGQGKSEDKMRITELDICCGST